MFRVTQPYINLLAKPRTFFMFSRKNIILCILKGEITFKMHKLYFLPEKENKKYVCLPYLKFVDSLPETHLVFFIWP